MDPKKLPEFQKLLKDNLGKKSIKKILMTDVMLDYKDLHTLRSSQKLVTNSNTARLKDSISETQLKELQSNSAVIKIDENKLKQLKESKILASGKNYEYSSKTKNDKIICNQMDNNIQQNNNFQQISNLLKHSQSKQISQNAQNAPLRVVSSSVNNIQVNNSRNQTTSCNINSNITNHPRDSNTNFEFLQGVSDEERRQIELAIKLSEESYEIEKFKYNNSRITENIKKLNTEVVKE